MKTRTNTILGIMKVVSWIIFIGLCIKAGALLISGSVSLFINPEGASNVYLGLDLSQLYNSSKMYYMYVLSFLIAITALKAYIFYLVIKIFSKINFDHPFSDSMVSLIAKISHVALGIGVVALIAQNYSKWLLKSGFEVQRDWGSSEFLFLAGIIFIIGLIFKRGVELQSENELTI